MSVPAANLLRHIRQLAAHQAFDQHSDQQLLERFAAERDEAMFALLVRRHGPMVLSVCRRVLRHEQDAEDAFQATFLILARKAGSIRQTDVGGYLYRVAYHVAIRARAKTNKYQQRPQQREVMPAANPPAEAAWRELRAVVDEELQRLPDDLRSALVLCYLEGKTQEEAARLLAWSIRTLRRRLEKGRELLRIRLISRGLAPMAALTATLFAESGAPAAVPAMLADATLRTVLASKISPAIAALAEAGLGVLAVGKTKAATALVLIGSMLAGAGLWACSILAVPQPTDPPKTPAPHSAEAPHKNDKDSLIIRGRVLGPNNKPVTGAKLYLPRRSKEERRSKDEREAWSNAAVIQRGSTDTDGRFRLQLPRQEIPLDRPVPLVAAADGFGLAWIELNPKEATSAVTLRMVKDVPIRGRIVSTEGKPMDGIMVAVLGVMAVERLDDFLRILQHEMKHADEGTGTRRLDLPLNRVLNVKSTDKDGRFEIHGLGGERVVGLEVQSAAITPTTMIVVTRANFDAKVFVKGAIPRRPEERRPLFFGPSFECVVARRLDEKKPIIEGVVREAGNGKPVAGATILAWGASAVTDAQGHYRLVGMLKQTDQYMLHVTAPKDLPLIGRQQRVTPAAGSKPMRADIELTRGVAVTGRVYDKATGKGISDCSISYASLPENKTPKKEGLSIYTMSGADGRFRLMTIPGPGVLFAQGGRLKIEGVPIHLYKEAEFDPADRRRVKMVDSLKPRRAFLSADGPVDLDISNACKVLDIKDRDTAVSCDLAFDPGKTRMVNLQDAEGKPLTGAEAAGIGSQELRTVPLKTDSCRIYALDPDKPRSVAFLHVERKLAALATLRGEEKEPVTVQLAPTSILTGRLLDGDGQPVVGAEVYTFYETPAGQQLTKSQVRNRLPRTDKEGRFRLETIVPGLPVRDLGFLKGRQMLISRTKLTVKPLTSGQTLDLGDIRTKPRR